MSVAAPMEGIAMSNGSIKLRAGGEVRVTSLRQWSVYFGLLEGLPTREMNRHTIESILAEERQSGEQPHLIEPVQTPIELPGGRRYPLGEPARLPGVACVASLVSTHGEGYAQVTVVWFQEEYAFPIDKAVMDQIVSLDWGKLAVSYEW
jgi:hypothetical protein